jgi:nucleoside phosphorylase
MEDIQERTEIGRELIARGISQDDLALVPTPAPPGPLARHLLIPFSDDLGPTPVPMAPAPDPAAPLPGADVVVITWTVDEQDALCDVFTPGFGRAAWYRYTRNFPDYAPRIRAGAPATAAQRLGSYFPCKVGATSVLCFKSELHLNQDGIRTGEGTATLPVKDLFLQIIEEANPSVVLTIGTSGGVFEDHQLGDVVVTRGAKFRLASEFRNEPFNGTVFTSDWEIPTARFDEAGSLMGAFAGELTEPPFLPPTKNYHYHGSMIHTDANVPDIKLDGRDMPAFHPILTTDYFEFGTSANRLDLEGAAVEMGDAALGLAAAELTHPPRWASVRNMSDPQINGDIPVAGYRLNAQTLWAVAYYTSYGYWTSVDGALATWAIVAGLSTE